MNNRALSKAEAAALVGICEKTMERLIAEGKIKAHRVGNRWKIFQRDLDEFLVACSNARPAERPSEPAAAEVLTGAAA